MSESEDLGRLRDNVEAALTHVIKVVESPLRDANLNDISRGFKKELRRRVEEAQTIWFSPSSVRRYLDRAEGPVFLDNKHPARTIGRVSGTCYHDLALGIAKGLVDRIELRHTVQEYLAEMRFLCGVGDAISERLTEILKQVGCESKSAQAIVTAQGLTYWISFAEAERVSGINRGLISRAAKTGEIKTNGEQGKGKIKIDAADFMRWQLERSKRPEQAESDEKVQRLLDAEAQSRKRNDQ
jgi:hypothetical protein